MGPRRTMMQYQRAMLNQPFGQQHFGEMEWLLQFVVGSRAILEVGCCFGQTTRMLAFAARGDVRVRAIDLGVTGGSLGGLETGAALYRQIAGLRDCGFDAQLLIGSSHTAIAKSWAQHHGPYDFILIDGDHEYEGVRQDWLDYGPMGKVVAFHDIAGEHDGVGRLWAEIKSAGLSTDEKIASPMGIGVVFNETREMRAA